MSLAAVEISAAARDRVGLTRPAALLAVLAMAVVWQTTRWGTIPDTSWGLTMAERVLAGDRLYTDLFETNPPFTVWLHIPPVALAHWLGLSPEFLFQAWTLLAVLIGLGFAGHVLRRAGFPEADRLRAWSLAIVAVLTLLPGNAFGEREHFGVVLLLPLLALQAWRAEGGRPGLAMAGLAGCAGSVIVLVKPYYAVLILAPALLVAWRRRSLWELFRPEYWTVGLISAAYLGAVLLFYPRFMTAIYPVLAETYLRVSVGLLGFLVYLVIFALMACVFRRLRPAGVLPSLPAVLSAASVAALLPMMYQGKAWPYHAFPAYSLLWIVLICLAARLYDGPRRGLPTRLAALAIIAGSAPFMTTQKPAPELVAAVRSAGPNPSVALIGTDLASGHPLTRMANGRWISAYCSDWLAGMALQLADEARQRGDGVQAAREEQILDRYASFKIDQFRRATPDVVIVETGAAEWLETLEKRGLAGLLDDYRQAAEADGLRVLVRSGAPPLSDS
jgi:hypothetical protein